MDFRPFGVIPALATPLNDDLSCSMTALRKLIDFQLEAGVHGLFVTGTAGECYALNSEQKRMVIEAAVEHTAGRVPVYAGTGEITTRDTIALTRMAEACGVDAVSVLTPYYIRPGQEELYQHYAAVAEATDLPIVLYNNSPMAGVGISAETAARLAKIDNIVGIKDSSGDFILTMEYLQAAEDFGVLAGREPLIYATLCGGGCGMVASTGNVIPKLLVALYEACTAGRLEEALKLQARVTEMYRLFALGSFPVVIKEGLSLLGIDAGPAFPPIQPLAPGARNRLGEFLEQEGR